MEISEKKKYKWTIWNNLWKSKTKNVYRKETTSNYQRNQKKIYA